MLSIVRFFLGWVSFYIKGKNAERCLNLAAKDNINIWNMQRKCDGEIFAKILASDYKDLIKYKKKLKIKIKLKKKFGFPFIIKKTKKRPGIIVGAFCFYIFLSFLSMFVWDINVSGNTKLNEDEIMESAAELGLNVGTKKEKIDTEFLEKEIMAKIPDLSWISINIRGSSAKIEVKEKKPVPKIVPNHKPCNIVAKKPGQITRIEVYKGRAEVKNGDGVVNGALLINAFEEDAFGKNTICHASGKVFAITKHFLKERLHLNQYTHTPTGEIINRKSVKFFGLKIPLTLNPRPGENYQKELSINKVRIGNSNLPITFYTEKCFGQNRIKTILSPEEAKKRCEENLKRREEFEFHDMKILNKEKNGRINNGVYYLETLYTCEENIAKELEFLQPIS